MANATANVQLNITGNAQQQLQKLQKSVSSVQSSFTGLRNALGGIAIGNFLLNVARSADAIDDLSKATGLSIATIQGFGQALQRSGGDAEDASKILGKFSVSLEELKEGSLESEYTLEKLGLTIADIRNLSDEDALRTIIASLAKMPASAERTALAMKLLGKDARSIDWNNLNNSIDKFIAKSQKAEAGTKALATLFDNLQGIGTSFAQQLTIGGESLTTTLVRLTNDTDKVAQSLVELVRVVGLLGTALALLRIPSVINDIIGMQRAFSKGKDLTWLFTSAITALKNAFGQLLTVIGLGNLANKRYAGGLQSIIDLIGNLGRAGARLGVIGIVAYSIGEAFRVLTGTFNPIQSFFNFLRDVAVVALARLKKEWDSLVESFKAWTELLGLQTAFKYLAESIVPIFTPALNWLENKLKDISKSWRATVAEAEQTLGIGAKPEGGGPLVIQGEGAQAMPKDYFKGSSQTEFERLRKGIQDTTKAFIDQKDAQLSLLRSQASYNLMSDETRAIIDAQRSIYDDFNNQIQEYENKISQLTPEQKKLEGVYLAQIATLKKLRDEQMVQAAEAVQATYQQINAQQDLQTELEKTYNQYGASNALSDLQAELDLLGLEGDELERQQRILQTQQQMRDTVQSVMKDLIALENKYGNNKDANYEREKSQLEQQLDIARQIAEGKLQIDKDYFEKKAELEASYTKGVEKALKDIAEQFKPINMAQEGVQKAWGRINDAVDTFVETGKFKFSDFARSVLQDLAKMIAKALIFKAISAALGAFGLKLPGLAAGGPAEAGQPYIVGEKGPELFVPNNSGKVIPNNQLGNGMGAGTVSAPVTNNYNTYNINALDAKSVAQLFAENRKAIFGANKMAEREMSYAGAR